VRFSSEAGRAPSSASSAASACHRHCGVPLCASSATLEISTADVLRGRRAVMVTSEPRSRLGLRTLSCGETMGRACARCLLSRFWHCSAGSGTAPSAGCWADAGPGFDDLEGVIAAPVAPPPVPPEWMLACPVPCFWRNAGSWPLQMPIPRWRHSLHFIARATVSPSCGFRSHLATSTAGFDLVRRCRFVRPQRLLGCGSRGGAWRGSRRRGWRRCSGSTRGLARFRCCSCRWRVA
jgi:hypothetical protein